MCGTEGRDLVLGGAVLSKWLMGAVCLSTLGEDAISFLCVTEEVEWGLRGGVRQLQGLKMQN